MVSLLVTMSLPDTFFTFRFRSQKRKGGSMVTNLQNSFGSLTRSQTMSLTVPLDFKLSAKRRAQELRITESELLSRMLSPDAVNELLRDQACHVADARHRLRVS